MKNLEIAKELASIITENMNQGFVLLLSGEMGAGKTTLVKEILDQFDSEIEVTSPTFTIVNQYAENIFHLDLYRLYKSSEFKHLGLEEILTEKNIVFIEWADKLPQEWLRLCRGPGLSIKITKINEEGRKFEIIS